MRWSWKPLPPDASSIGGGWRGAMLLRDGAYVGAVAFGPEVAMFRHALLDDICLALSEPSRCDVPLADIEGD